MRTEAKKRSTLAEIALASGCSKAVASTVLNGSRGNTVVGRQLRERVERCAREVGYVPNHASQTLATGQSQSLGVYIMPGYWARLVAEYESAILRGVDQACQAAGYDVLIFNLSGANAFDAMARKIASRRVDGVLVVRARSGSENLERLLDACENVVAADFNEVPSARMRCVGYDNAAAMRLAVEHLASLGHRRIGYVGGGTPEPVPDDLSRRIGFEHAMAGAGLAVDPRTLFCHWLTPPSRSEPGAQTWGWEVVDRVVAMGDERPTALVFWSDSVAVTAMQRVAQHGLSIPRDISLVGVDNSPSCKVVWPHLTAVDHPLVEIGAEAARMLIETANAARHDSAAGEETVRRTVLQPTLVVRGTTGRVELQ